MFCFLSFLPFYLTAIPLSVSHDVKSIDEEIHALKNQLNKNRVNEMNEEVEGQRFMIADWDAYAKDFQHIRKMEEEDKQIIQRIQMLEERKAHLIKMQTNPQQ